MGCCANERQDPQRQNQNGGLADAELDKRINELFAKYDKDGSGSLDTQETMNLLNDILKDHNQTVSEKETRNFIIATDKNGDGKIQKG